MPCFRYETVRAREIKPFSDPWTWWPGKIFVRDHAGNFSCGRACFRTYSTRREVRECLESEIFGISETSGDLVTSELSARVILCIDGANREWLLLMLQRTDF